MNEWISIKDRLPSHGQQVLCYQNYPKGTMIKTLAKPLIGCNYQIAEFGTYGNGFIDKIGMDLKHVPHWIPLPEPPKEINE
jgi:hypothetical protein